MKMARVILFTGQMDAMTRFYGEVLGLKQVTAEKGWREFAAGGARIALRSGPASPGRKGPEDRVLCQGCCGDSLRRPRRPMVKRRFLVLPRSRIPEWVRGREGGDIVEAGFRCVFMAPYRTELSGAGIRWHGEVMESNRTGTEDRHGMGSLFFS